MTSLWGSLAPAQPRGLFGSDDDWLLTRAINGLGFGPMTQATQAGRPNGYISNGPARPNDYLAPVAETISPTMGAYGAGQMMAEGSRAIGQGDYLSGGAGLALGMAGMIPGAPKKGIRAFHGSPHDFDKFSLDKIGTGEGAQAYGHGLYFAENEGVAKAYRDNLSRPFTADGARYKKIADEASDFLARVPDFGGDLDVVELKRLYNLGYFERADKATANKIIQAWDDGNIRRGGRMYEVSINADPEDFLDWDKPLSQQPETVWRLFNDSLKAKGIETRSIGKRNDGSELVDVYQRGGGSFGVFPPDRVKDVMDRPADFFPVASGKDLKENLGLSEDVLREAGIPGIRYLDQGSRGAGEGSRNYVVFDDALIEIMKKYGLFGSLGLGGASGLFGAAGEQSQ